MSTLRFAPSPTGYLHVGNARIALLNWLFARHSGARFLLRLDDTDATRTRPEYAAAIAPDLAWLGLDWDGFLRQSDRLAAYEAAAARLRQAGRLYPAWETAEELEAKRRAALKRGRPPVYDRAALAPGASERGRASGNPPHWRFRLSEGAASWHDLVLGSRRIPLGSLSDPVVLRADGTPLYLFTSVVDDLAEAVTTILRGEDHVSNTAIQRDMAAALGADPDTIRYAHLPLLHDAEGAKLSKRVGALSLRALKREGFEPGAVAAYLASLGAGHEPTPLPLPELAAGFDLARFSRSPARFDPAQLLALNRRLLHGLGFEAVSERLPPGADAQFWNLVRANLDLVPEAREWWEILHGDLDPPAPNPADEAFLTQAAALLPPAPWGEETPHSWIEALRATSGRKGRSLYGPLRRALTGHEHGPELVPLLARLGPERISRRLGAAAARSRP